jgi:hypothetical protein
MKSRLAIGVALVLIGFSFSAFAESAAQAMQAFGLIGTWSYDCAKDPLNGGVRYTYAAPMFGSATETTVVSAPAGNGPGPPYFVFKSQYEIKSAERVTEEKITYPSVDVYDVSRR